MQEREEEVRGIQEGKAEPFFLHVIKKTPKALLHACIRFITTTTTTIIFSLYLPFSLLRLSKFSTFPYTPTLVFTWLLLVQFAIRPYLLAKRKRVSSSCVFFLLLFMFSWFSRFSFSVLTLFTLQGICRRKHFVIQHSLCITFFCYCLFIIFFSVCKSSRQ